MANDNARNRPRYPLDRRCVRMLICDEETAYETPAAGKAEDCTETVRTAREGDTALPRNPFGTAFG